SAACRSHARECRSFRVTRSRTSAPCRQGSAPAAQGTSQERWSIRLPATCSFIPHLDLNWLHKHDLLCLKIYTWNRCVVERQYQGFATGHRHDLDDVAGAEIMQCIHRPDLNTLRCDDIETDQVGVIVRILLVNLRQPFPRNIKLEIP